MIINHLVMYEASTDGQATVGVARVGAIRDTPTERDIAFAIPGYVPGSAIDLGPEPTYLLRYETRTGPVQLEIGSKDVVREGAYLQKRADRDDVWNIAVLDPQTGDDITFDFFVFCT